MSITIDSNIPIPTARGGNGRPAKYPIASMKVGDSFAFPKKSASCVRQSASQFRRRTQPDWRFITRSISATECRIWRIA